MNGLIVRLKKRHQDSAKENDLGRGYLMWGFYDQMQVFHVSDWKDLEPTTAYAQKEDEPFDESAPPPFHEEYPLKLLMPYPLSDDICFHSLDAKKAYQFCYGEWVPYSEAQPTEVDGGVFVSIAILQFTGEAVTHISRRAAEAHAESHALLNDVLQRQIARVAAEIGITPEQFSADLRCATYSTTGFGDMVIVFRTARFDWVSDIIFELRSCDAIYGDAALLSTSYLMCGVSNRIDLKQALPAVREAGKHMRFSMRFLLKPGVSPQSFYDALRNHVAKRKKPHCGGGISLPQLEDLSSPAHEGNQHSDELLYSQMFGNSDVLLLPNTPIDSLLCEYVDPEGFMNPNHPFLPRYVYATRTSMRRIPQRISPVTASGDPPIIEQGVRPWTRLQDFWARKKTSGSGEPTTAALTSDDIAEFSSPRATTLSPCLVHGFNAIDTYTKARTNALSRCGVTFVDHHPRLLRGIRHAMNLYRDLSQPEHAYDIKSMLDPVIASFAVNLEQATKLLNEHAQILADLSPEAYPAEHTHALRQVLAIIQRIDENQQMFRHEFNELLLDLLRADRQFIEGRGMLHGAVGSATKLILAYSEAIHDITYCLRDDSGQHTEDCTYVAMLSCGGADKTEAHRLFAFLPPDMPDPMDLRGMTEHILLQIRLPERTLFHIGATMFFLAHEVLHHVGYRANVERAQYVQESIVAYLVFHITSVLYDHSKTAFKQKIDSVLVKNHTEDDGANALKATDEICDRKRDLFRHNAQQMLLNMLDHADNKIKGVHSFSKNLRDLLAARFTRILSPRYYSESNWAQHRKTQFAHYVAHQYYLDLRQEAKPLIEYCELHDIDYKNLLRDIPELQQPQYLTKDLERLFDILIENKCASDEYFPLKDGTQRHVSTLPSVYAATNGILDGYLEAYVDSMAYSFLHCEPWEYLSIFLYENEAPILHALSPLSPHVVLRIGCVLSVCDISVNNCLNAILEKSFETQLATLLSKWETEIYTKGLWTDSRSNGSTNVVNTVSAKLFVEHIGNLLRVYRNVYLKHQIAQPLEQYIVLCKRVQQSQQNMSPTKHECQKNINELFHAGMAMPHDLAMQDKAWRMLLDYWMTSAQASE